MFEYEGDRGQFAVAQLTFDGKPTEIAVSTRKQAKILQIALTPHDFVISWSTGPDYVWQVGETLREKPYEVSHIDKFHPRSSGGSYDEVCICWCTPMASTDFSSVEWAMDSAA